MDLSTRRGRYNWKRRALQRFRAEGLLTYVQESATLWLLTFDKPGSDVQAGKGVCITLLKSPIEGNYLRYMHRSAVWTPVEPDEAVDVILNLLLDPIERLARL